GVGGCAGRGGARVSPPPRAPPAGRFAPAPPPPRAPLAPRGGRTPPPRAAAPPPVVGQRPVAPPAPGVLLRELRRDRVGVVGVEQLEALRDAPVQQPPFRRADLGVCSFAEPVVGEVVAVAELLHDSAPPQLVDRSE